jgi:hypothetical protein
MTASPEAPAGGLDTPAGVLTFARSRRADADRAVADVLLAAVTWAEQHPPESIDAAATWIAGGGAETGIPLAGEGAPLVAEFCVAEFALAIGRSTDSGRSLVADALELKYRLPRVFARVVGGELPVWKARRVAQATLGLSREAAAFVDAQVVAFAHKIGPAVLDRLVEEAIGRFMPEKALEDAHRAADGRHVTFHHSQVSFNGTTVVEAELELADALDLDVAITQGAESLAAGGCEETLDVRRAIAVGELARNQLALDLHASADGKPSRGVKPRQVILYVHVSEAAITRASTLDVARVENQQLTLTAEQVKTWCANPDAQVVVKPVIDLKEHIGVESYEVPDRLAEQTRLVNHTCVFSMVHSASTTVRLRPCHRPRRPRIDLLVQHRAPVQTAPSVEDTLDVDLHRPRTRLVPVVQPARLPVPARPHRHRRRHPRTPTTPGGRSAAPVLPRLWLRLSSLVTREHPRGDSAPSHRLRRSFPWRGQPVMR